MKKIEIKVEASLGTEVRVGDEIKAGEFLGIDAKTWKKVFSPMDGFVEECGFEAERHEFIITITAILKRQ